MFFVRQSKMIGRKNYLYNNLEDTDTKEILTEFVKQYYIKNENVPSKIMISEEILDKEEAIEDEKIENEETISIAVVLVILFVCFLVGILLGYLLYHIAINSSNSLLIIQNLF